MPRRKATHQGGCPACERLIALRGDGTLVFHWIRGHRSNGACPGSHRRPIAETVLRIGESPLLRSGRSLLEELEHGILKQRPPAQLLEICEQLAGKL